MTSSPVRTGADCSLSGGGGNPAEMPDQPLGMGGQAAEVADADPEVASAQGSAERHDAGSPSTCRHRSAAAFETTATPMPLSTTRQTRVEAGQPDAQAQPPSRRGRHGRRDDPAARCRRAGRRSRGPAHRVKAIWRRSASGCSMRHRPGPAGPRQRERSRSSAAASTASATMPMSARPPATPRTISGLGRSSSSTSMLRMRRQEGPEQRRQEFERRGGVGEHADAGRAGPWRSRRGRRASARSAG